MKKHITVFSSRMKANWKSGITVALVSLPLSVSLAVASGTTPTVGIITAIWGGFFAAMFGGSHYNIVGPTGALSGVIAVYAAAHGAGALPMLAVASGVLTLIAWRFKCERFVRYIPEHTIHGFTIGVAVTIAATQLGGALGIQLPSGVTEQFDKIVYYITHAGSMQGIVFAVFIAGLSFLFISKKYIPSIPGAILLSPIGILIGYLAKHGFLHMPLLTLGDVYPTIIPRVFTPSIFVFSPSLIVPAIGVALIAIIETSISAQVADAATGTTHNPQKEIFGLGIGNIVAGVLGGMPATAALARTSLNIRSGADHKTSAGINALSIVVISFVFLSSFTYIPMAVIAAILVFVAYQLIERDALVHSWKHSKGQFFIILLVAAICVYKDTIWGIAVGVLIGGIIAVAHKKRNLVY